MADFNQDIIEQFHANGGQVGGMFAGMQLLLLHSTGAKSGHNRVVPLAYTLDNDDYVVVASKGGAPTNPDWYHNVQAHPDVTVEVGTDKFQAKARITHGTERDRLFQQHAEQYPQFHDYTKKTTRVLPVIVLHKED